MSTEPSKPSARQTLVSVYYFGYRLIVGLRGILLHLHAALYALFTGVWLGILNRETLLSIDEKYYSDMRKYQDPDYNRGGLFDWEARVVTDYFSSERPLLLVGAGGGREVVGLYERGFRVKAVECNPDLVKAANDLLRAEGYTAQVSWAPPDTCPADGTDYGGLVIGWGAYMLIQGRVRRIDLLKSMRAQVQPGTPLLLSFFYRSPNERRFVLTYAIANSLRRMLGRPPVELGDTLQPEFVHYFSEATLKAELEAAGFILELLRPTPYAHAVAKAH